MFISQLYITSYNNVESSLRAVEATINISAGVKNSQVLWYIYCKLSIKSVVRAFTDGSTFSEGIYFIYVFFFFLLYVTDVNMAVNTTKPECLSLFIYLFITKLLLSFIRRVLT